MSFIRKKQSILCKAFLNNIKAVETRNAVILRLYLTLCL